jgi:hypothetical protein
MHARASRERKKKTFEALQEVCHCQQINTINLLGRFILDNLSMHIVSTQRVDQLEAVAVGLMEVVYGPVMLQIWATFEYALYFLVIDDVCP